MNQFWSRRQVDIAPSHWADLAATEVSVRDAGAGPVIFFLHGGWGYDVYAFDAIARTLVDAGFRCVAPDRAGYGRSSPIPGQPLDFHQRAAAETRAVLDALGIETALLWGHSDGAVVAVWTALQAPARMTGLVLESLHSWKQKPRSAEFFQAAAEGRPRVSARTQGLLVADHGSRWQEVMRMNGQVWLELARTADGPHDDLYAGRLAEIRVPALLIRGGQDPRLEPGETEWAIARLRSGRRLDLEGKHVPHLDADWSRVQADALEFVERTARS